MTFNFDEEYKLRIILKNIYAPVQASHDIRQRVRNRVLEADMEAKIAVMRFDPFARICIPVLAVISMALIMYGYIAAAWVG